MNHNFTIFKIFEIVIITISQHNTISFLGRVTISQHNTILFQDYFTTLLELFFCFKHDFAFRAKHIFVLFLMLLRTKIIFLDEILQKGYIDIVDIINIGDIIMISVILSLMLMTMLILIISHYLKLVVNIRNCCSI